MSAVIRYADLEIRILELQEDGYPVELTLNMEQQYQRGYLNPAFLPWQPGDTPAADGPALMEWLLADETLRAAWHTVRGRHGQRRIRLRIDATAPELHAIPWELLQEIDADSDVPVDVAAALATPFSRYLAGSWQPGTPVLKRPIKILVAIANPDNLEDSGLPSFDPDEEWSILDAATTELQKANVVNLVRLPQPCSLAALEQALKQGVHILHFVGHGGFDEETRSAFLVMADDQNQATPIYDRDFAAMLARLLGDPNTNREEKLRLTVLDSCQTATRDTSDAFRGFAPQLVQVGVPAVLAMQDFVAVKTGQAFSATFYRQLLTHGQVDLACNEARSSLISARLPGSAVPVLFLRLKDGLLFGQRGRVLSEAASSFWNTLLDNIAEGEVTPFLGPQVSADWLPLPRELAQTLAHDYNYPFVDSSDLPRVAQFVGTLDNRRLRREVQQALVNGLSRRLGQELGKEARRLSLADVTEKLEWAQRSKELVENEIYHQLADLKLPLYVTTSFDSFMTQALRAHGTDARRQVVDWRQPPSTTAQRPHHDLDPPASPDSPVVLHLFGSDDDLLSMVLTEDDYLDYLARISRDYEFLLPTSVNESLASTTLFFLGYGLDDIEMKVLMRGLLTNLDLERWDMLHVAVQIDEAGLDQTRYTEVIQYFQRYFSKLKIDVYWGSAHQFMAELHARWQEYK